MTTLDCVASGDPPPNVSWLLNREPVNFTTGGFQQLDNGSLVIATPSDDTAGFYTCVADNGFGRSEVTVSLIVTSHDDYTATNETGGRSLHACEIDTLAWDALINM